MARIFVEIVKDADPYPISESDWEVLFDIAPSLDSEKLHVAEEYWGGTQPDRDVRMFALDYYATSDFPKDLQDELLEALSNEIGDAEVIVSVEPGLPSPNWAYRTMDTDYTLREAQADWFKGDKAEKNPTKKAAKNPGSTCTGCGKAISGVYEAGSYSCSECGTGVEINPTSNPSSQELFDSIDYNSRVTIRVPSAYSRAGKEVTGTAVWKRGGRQFDPQVPNWFLKIGNKGDGALVTADDDIVKVTKGRVPAGYKRANPTEEWQNTGRPVTWEEAQTLTIDEQLQISRGPKPPAELCGELKMSGRWCAEPALTPGRCKRHAPKLSTRMEAIREARS